jgi:hypothetical protein
MPSNQRSFSAWAIGVLAAVLTLLAVAPQAHAAGGYATVCADPNQGGRCQEVFGTIRDLRGTAIGDDQITSIQTHEVSSGVRARVTLWADPGLTGNCQEFTLGAQDKNLDLRGSWIGDDSVTSISVTLYSMCPKPGVAVDACAGSRCGVLNRSVANTRDSYLGDDSLTQLIVRNNAQPVSVYSEPNFEGTCWTANNDYNAAFDSSTTRAAPLRNKVSSIAIGRSCTDDVLLCRDPVTFKEQWTSASCAAYPSSKPNLGATDVGNDTVTTIRVPAGTGAVAWSDANYQGTYFSLPGLFLPYNPGFALEPTAAAFGPGVPVHDDTLSSIRIWHQSDCRAVYGLGCLNY